MKIIIPLVFFLTILTIQASAQFSPPKLSLGIQYSDILSITTDYAEGNAWKRGVWGTLGTEYKILPWLAVEGNITYQERKPLEVFVFRSRDSTGTAGEGHYKWVFAKHPTSPQSKLFNNSFYKYIVFPNFKYLDLEVIPVFKFGKKVEWSVGVGIFVGILLNRDQLIFGKEYFPSEQFFFGPPFYVYGTVSYHRYDYGWIPKISCAYPINPKTKIGITFKSYQSRVRLNDNFAYSTLVWNIRWTSFLGGLDIQYKF